MSGMIFKRLFDVIVAGVGLLLSLPLIAVASLFIWATDKSSPLYMTHRIGRGGKKFRAYKLRTMVVGADRNGATTARHGDARITSVGAILRRTKIDELPQFVNVIAGDMSLVGPRVTIEKVIERYDAFDRSVILSVRPGVSGLSAVVFSDLDYLVKGQTDPEAAYFRHVFPWITRFEIYYIETRTFWLDLSLVALTAVNLVSRGWALERLAAILARRGAPAEIVQMAHRRGDFFSELKLSSYSVGSR